MGIFDRIYEKAMENPARIAFPECLNEKMLRAAQEAAMKGLTIPVMVGDATASKNLCELLGINSSLFSFVDINDETYRDELIAQYVTIPGTVFKSRSLQRRMTDPLYFALVMEMVGDVDCVFAGIDYTTGAVILAGQSIVGFADGIATASSLGIFEIPGYEGSEGQFLAFGDSGVCQNPDADGLASIAISCCDTVESLLGWEPRCAMLSYSTCGSSEGVLVDKVLEALKLVRERRPELAIDGEFQLDAAVSPVVAAKKVRRESSVAGKANVIIWPDLNAGNIGVKLVQQFGKAQAYGPILQGFKKVVSDCSRGADVSEIVSNIAISSVRASNAKFKQS